MQFLTSLALFASAVMASPIDMEARQFSTMAIYKIKLTSTTYPSLNEKYLSTYNNTVGVYDNHSPVLVTTNQLPNKNLELHIKDSLVDAVIYLQSSGSLAQMAVMSPNSGTGPQPSDFQSFAMGPTSGKLHPLSVTSKSGEWLAFPGTDNQWTVSWISPADNFFIETAQLVQVSLENYID